LTSDAQPPDVPPGGGNAVAAIAVLLLAAWIAGLAFVLYPVVWLVEQFSIAGGREFGRPIWVAVAAGHAGAVLLPSLLGLALTRAPRYRVVFRTWSLAGLFALVVAPVQLVAPPAAQMAAVVQIAGAAVYLALLFFLRRYRPPQPPSIARRLWPAALAAALIGWAWAAWGALGSPVDSALNLAAALLFGLAAGGLLSDHLFAHSVERDGAPPLPFFASGLVAGTSLLTMGAAFGYDGQRLILLFLLSGLGWLAAAVARWSGGDEPGMNRPGVGALIALVVAAPLLFVDGDELLLVLNLGTRDVGYYALWATAIGWATALLLGLIAWPLSRRAEDGRWPWTAIVAIGALTGLVAVYAVLGQPGWHGERLYVILAEQADLSAAAGIADPDERRAAIYEDLVQ
jgi:hypothetical protein